MNIWVYNFYMAQLDKRSEMIAHYLKLEISNGKVDALF